MIDGPDSGGSTHKCDEGRGDRVKQVETLNPISSGTQ